MEEELAQLRARVEILEKRWEHVLGLADRIDAQVSSINAMEDSFVIPALLHLGGDAIRSQMLRWLDRLAQQQRIWIEDEGTGQLELQRLEYWQDVLRKREPWPQFPPEGWESPRVPKERPFG